MAAAERDRIKEPERETRQLRQANEFFKKASAYFAQAEIARTFLQMIAFIKDHISAHGVDAGLEASVGSVGDSYDNVLAETIFGQFETEVINRLGLWKSKDQVE